MTGLARLVVLVVEDNPADADLVRAVLEGFGGYAVEHVLTMTDAFERLGSAVGDPVDVVIMDLRLPDGAGVDAVLAMRDATGPTPIIVLTGVEDDERSALACIDAGAQDYLHKGEMRSVTLRRSIGYAVSRAREAEVRALRDALERYRQMAGDGSGTTVTAALAGTASIKEQYPDQFDEFVTRYIAVLRRHFDRLVLRAEKPRDEIERIVTGLGDLGAGPRDLIDVHVAALHRSVEVKTGEKARTFQSEGRLLALEMMGRLVDYYRIGRSGLRRREG